MDVLKAMMLIFLMSIIIPMKAQESKGSLNTQDRCLVNIAALTAIGDQLQLKQALADGLDAGFTVNQINDVLAQLYAYCGFPRSLNATGTFMKVVEERKARGITDRQGASLNAEAEGDRYERGLKTLKTLTGKDQMKPAPGFGEFNPTVDRFLKEHLFADIFDSKQLTYRQREVATIAALSTMQGVEPQLQAHFGIGTNEGITITEMDEIVTISSGLATSKIEDTETSKARIELLKLQLAGSGTIAHDASANHIVRIAEIEIFPEYFEEYLRILKEESRASVQKEPGVISILPLVMKQSPNQIRILEFYVSKEAYQVHLASAHFRHYKSATLNMVKKLWLEDMYLIDTLTLPLIFEKVQNTGR